MPYIEQELRNKIDMGAVRPCSPGELNYAFSNIISQYLLDMGLKYDTINDILGALEGAKLEFYRRIAVPYEEQKMIIQGDVYKLGLLL